MATDEGLTIRISFSNMFKEFKSTSTWLQFPFVSSPRPGSVDEVTGNEMTTLSSKCLLPIIMYDYMGSVYVCV